jgi:hypothetical protein
LRTATIAADLSLLNTLPLTLLILRSLLEQAFEHVSDTVFDFTLGCDLQSIEEARLLMSRLVSQCPRRASYLPASKTSHSNLSFPICEAMRNPWFQAEIDFVHSLHFNTAEQADAKGMSFHERVALRLRHGLDWTVGQLR